MATAILMELFDIEVVRTRNEETLKELEIVYDVGGGEFDHHGINKTYREDGIPYAACGLIWKRFGRDVVRLKEPSLEEEIDSLFGYVDRVLIQGIDALDNGIWIGDGEIPLMNISSIIAGFNPPWYSEKPEDEAFNEAVELSGNVLRNVIKNRLAVSKSREIVKNAYENRSVPEILVLDTYCPWGETLRSIDEKEEVLYVVFPSKENYTLQTVRGRYGEDRKPLPEAWAGKRDEELAAVTGVKDSVFCHTGRFIAVAESFEGIMKMAALAVKHRERWSTRKFIKFIKRLFSRKGKRRR
jgi:uncharacterized UPF0160 family protein